MFNPILKENVQGQGYYVFVCPQNGIITSLCVAAALLWRHNELDGVSNNLRLDCLFNRLFRRISKKTPKLHVTRLCEGNVTRDRWIPRTKGQ